MARQFFTRFLPCVALTPAVSAFLGSNRDQFAPYTKKDAYDPVARIKELLYLHQKLYALSDEINYGDTGKGKSLEIVRLQEEKMKDDVVYKLKLNEENLERVMLHPQVKDKPVVIVSVAGEFRTGKSFLLNIFLKYLESGRKESDWLTGHIEGFEWKGGHTPVTHGVHLWSEPFVMQGAKGENVAVLLMDTRGLFDNHMTATDSAKVFVLSSLISSVQILNIKEHLQANDMQALETFAQYSSLVEQISKHSDSEDLTPLVFLIRDWADKKAHPYGRKGGTDYVTKTLYEMDSPQKEIKKLHNTITSRFPNREGFLLPHPGITVIQCEFGGNVKEMDGDFKHHVQAFVPFIMSKEKLMPKKFLGETVTGEDMFHFIQTLVSNLEKSPDIPSHVEGFWLKLMMKTVGDATEIYRKEMIKALGVHTNVIKDKVFRIYHHESQKKAKDFFFEQPSTKKMEKDIITDLELLLEEQIRESKEKLRLEISNHNKKLKSNGIFGTIFWGLSYIGSPLVYILKSIFGF